MAVQGPRPRERSAGLSFSSRRGGAARMPETKAGKEAKAFLLDSAKTLDKAARIKRRVLH